jgi:ABC-2 type transport system permease protein
MRVALSWISVFDRFNNFTNGVFDIGAVVYFASLVFVFLFLTVRVYEKRRWS